MWDGNHPHVVAFVAKDGLVYVDWAFLNRPSKDPWTKHVAALLEEMGHKEAAEQLLNQEPVVLQVASTPAAPKVAGISFRDSYSCEVVSVLELARWVVDHPNHANLIQGNQVALNQLARVMKGGMNIPGVRAVCKKIQSAGSV